MNRALLLAWLPSTDGGPACLLELDGSPLLRRVVEQVRRADRVDITVLTRPEWAEGVRSAVDVEVVTADDTSEALATMGEVAERTDGHVVVMHADQVTHDSSVLAVLDDPRVSTAALVDDSPREDCAPVRIARTRLVASGSAFHEVADPNGALLGIVRIGAGARAELAAVARDLAALLEPPLPEEWRDASVHETDVIDPLALLTTGLVRRGVTVGAVELRQLHWSRPVSRHDVETAWTRLAEVDEDAVRLDSAVKAEDGFFTTFLVSPYSRYIARWTARAGATPNQVTVASMLVGAGAAGAFAVGSRGWLVVGALLLHVAFTLDCVDGQLARYTRQFSPVGGWLDAIFDRGKEYLAYAGLAVGAARGGTDGIWALAVAALALQTFRHLVDFSFAAQQVDDLAERAQGPLERRHDAPPRQRPAGPPSSRAGVGGLASLAVRASHAAERGWLRWIKRIFVLPIGERFALIAVTAAVWGPRVTFWSLLAWGSLAAAYTIAGRVARSLT